MEGTFSGDEMLCILIVIFIQLYAFVRIHRMVYAMKGDSPYVNHISVNLTFKK